MGWNYLICWTLILAAELSATAVLISYWIPTSQVNPAVWIAIGSIITLGLNAFSAGVYGEAEFWFASIKVITILGLIFVSIYITSDGGPNGESIGFKYWNDPGPFVQFRGIEGTTGRFLGFFSVLTQASFSMIGAEMLALAAAECRNPRRVLPVCLRTVWIRIVFFYVVSVFMVGLIVPSNNPRLGTESTAAASPTSLRSKQPASASYRTSSMPPSSQVLCLPDAVICTPPRERCIRWRRRSRHPRSLPAPPRRCPPLRCARVLARRMPGLLGSSAGSGQVFNFLVNLTALSGILTWFSIAITYLRLPCRHEGTVDPARLTARKSPLSLFAAYWTIFVIGLVLIFSGWEVFRPGKWNSAASSATTCP